LPHSAWHRVDWGTTVRDALKLSLVTALLGGVVYASAEFTDITQMATQLLQQAINLLHRMS